ncbi:MAG: T9SS type A sorting domain-containing protein [Flammeovirgaceae bacterium]
MKQSTFDIPNQGETSDNVWYRIILTVKDAEGLEGKDSVDVFPRKSIITFETIPTGLQLTLDGQPFTSPKSVVSVQGILRTIGVVNPQTLNNIQYQFNSWANAGTVEQTFATPAVNTTYVATFSIVLGTEDLFSSKPYPNPASDWIHFDKLEAAEVSVHDLVGRVSLLPVQQSISGATVYVGHLATGFYFIDSGSGVKQKVLINR